MKNYNKLKKLIQEAVPNRIWEHECESNQCDAFFTEPIRLADVLLVIQDRHKSRVNEVRMRLDIIQNLLMEKWNLKDNSLDNQSDETKRFLIDLLVPNHD